MAEEATLANDSADNAGAGEVKSSGGTEKSSERNASMSLRLRTPGASTKTSTSN